MKKTLIVVGLLGAQMLFGQAGQQQGYRDFPEISAPSNPAANTLRCYTYDEGGVSKYACRDSAGVVTTMEDFGKTVWFDPRRDGILLDDTTADETCTLDLEKHTTANPSIYHWHCEFNDDDNIQFAGWSPAGDWSSITARVAWHDDDTTCNVDWAVSIWSADDGDTNTGGSFDTVNTIDEAASPGANQIDYAEVAVTNDDTLTAEEYFVVNISLIDDGTTCSDAVDAADRIALDAFALIFE